MVEKVFSLPWHACTNIFLILNTIRYLKVHTIFIVLISVFYTMKRLQALNLHTGAEVNNAHLPNSLDWRVGLSYSIWKITASVKCDIGLLRQMKHPRTGGYDDKQVPVLGIGIAYNL